MRRSQREGVSDLGFGIWMINADRVNKRRKLETNCGESRSQKLSSEGKVELVTV